MKIQVIRAVAGALAIGIAVDAKAQMAVFDIQSLIQLQQQVSYWEQQIAAMSTQVNTLRQQYASTTGGRGMGSLLTTPNSSRNYLPTTATGIQAAASGVRPQDSALHSLYVAAIDDQTELSPDVGVHLSAADMATLRNRRNAVAIRSSVMQSALTNASARFQSLQNLIDEIDRTPDSKASMDLQGRISAEQVMASNEAAKLSAIAGWSDAEMASAQTQAREAALTAQGAFAKRFRPISR